ncbi:DUF421 domain-containing protein [Clostridium fallax]|uniref:Uncharacterized membrane protein YcaP, DUF421 family n=1 Tax=Clostridium fallax TaxID=1533 RepID=A0A1M4SUJ4_9CLOT|nr:DUF421 domain-containing protein [Clostridium fallax]SHE35657.1 Uncharacterized membrane protein YcaP, DUF421 family [Clostridium fallax]SQB07970.1 Protein of uncharacterised function (DUF421) [Clostridium fallax]
MIIVIIRTVLLYFLVVLIMRLMGKRQIGELQPYELVITMMISDLASLPMQDTRLPLLLGVIPIVTLLILKTVLSELQLKSYFARKVLDGTPCIIIKNGEINFSALKDQRINIDDLMEGLRLNGFFDVTDIQYAILENNGQLSIIPKNDSSPVTKADLKIKEKDAELPLVLLIDGRLSETALKSLGKNHNWFNKQLKKNNIKSKDDLFIAMINSKGEFYFQKKNNKNSQNS